MQEQIEKFSPIQFSDHLEDIGIQLEDYFDTNDFIQQGENINDAITYLQNYFQNLSQEEDGLFQLSKNIIFSYIHLQIEKENEKKHKKNQNQNNNINNSDNEEEQSIQQQYNSQNPHQNSNISNSTSSTSKHQQIHNKLYEDAQHIREVKHKMLQNLKQKIETKECTFKPDIGRDSSKNNENKQQKFQNHNVFKRLAQPKHKSLSMSQQQYLQNKENQYQFEQSKFSTKNSIASNKFSEQNQNQNQKQVFDRLYEEGQYKKEKLAIFEEIKNQMIDKEMEQHKLYSQRKQYKNQYQQQLENPVEVSQRLYNNHFDRQIQNVAKSIQSKEQEIKDCTFKPQINDNSHIYSSQQNQNQDKSQDQNQNNQSQECFSRLYQNAQRKNQKFNKLEQKIKNNKLSPDRRSYTPNINKKSQEMFSNVPVHERLFQISKQQPEKQNQLKNKLNEEQGCTFKPVLNSNSNQVLMNRANSTSALIQNSKLNSTLNNNQGTDNLTKHHIIQQKQLQEEIQNNNNKLNYYSQLGQNKLQEVKLNQSSQNLVNQYSQKFDMQSITNILQQNNQGALQISRKLQTGINNTMDISNFSQSHLINNTTNYNTKLSDLQNKSNQQQQQQQQQLQQQYQSQNSQQYFNNDSFMVQNQNQPISDFQESPVKRENNQFSEESPLRNFENQEDFNKIQNQEQDQQHQQISEQQYIYPETQRNKSRDHHDQNDNNNKYSNSTQEYLQNSNFQSNQQKAELLQQQIKQKQQLIQQNQNYMFQEQGSEEVL